MKTYKPEYKDKKTGKNKKCAHYCLTFVDNRQIRRRLPAYSDKVATDRLGMQIQKLIDANGVLDKDLQAWFTGLVPAVRDKLLEFGLVDSNRVSSHLGKTLKKHLDDFHAALLARGNTEGYANQVKNSIETILDGCGFTMWSDIDANRIYTFLADLRGDDGVGERTFNYHLKSCKQFCKWLCKERRATENPLEHLSGIKQTEKRCRRRALTIDEQRKLLETTRNGTVHHNMTGYERSLVYTLALQTGLRANEIRCLTVGSFDFKENTITLQAAYTKNKKTALIELKPETAAELKSLFASKTWDTRAFAMPDQPSKMIKIDLEAAQIPYETAEGTADFHSLRHSFITNLARAGVHPSDAMALARHSTITLTMNFYTHTKRESLRKIINEQPNLTIKQNENRRIA
jgi:integrase/recombinase XerD